MKIYLFVLWFGIVLCLDDGGVGDYTKVMIQVWLVIVMVTVEIRTFIGAQNNFVKIKYFAGI